MLRFRDFRNKINEAEVGPDHAVNAAIEELVDRWIDDLKHEILSGSTPPRGLWDRFRNTLANFWFGRNSEENPYKHRNLLGSMGDKVESVVHNTCSLQEYKHLRESCDLMEAEVAKAPTAPKDTTNQIKLIQIINKYGQMLKDRLKQMLVGAYVPTIKKYQMPALSSFPARPEAPKPVVKTEPEAKDAGTPEEMPDTEVSPEPEKEFSFSEPPSSGVEWHGLSAEQKMAWNKYGGGAVPRSERHKGKFPLPWILRLGDPRKSLLSPDTLKSLIRDKRLEMEGERIKNQAELEARVQASQSLFKNRKRRIVADTELRDEETPAPKSRRTGLPRPDTSVPPMDDEPEVTARNADAEPDVSSTTDFRDAEEIKPERKEMATLNRLVADWPDEEQKKQLLKLARKMKKEELIVKIKDFLQQTVDEEPTGDSKSHNQSMLDDQTEDVDSLNSTARLILGIFHPTEANRHFLNKFRTLVYG